MILILTNVRSFVNLVTFNKKIEVGKIVANTYIDGLDSGARRPVECFE